MNRKELKGIEGVLKGELEQCPECGKFIDPNNECLNCMLNDIKEKVKEMEGVKDGSVEK